MKKAFCSKFQSLLLWCAAFLLLSCGSEDFVNPLTLRSVGQVAGIQVANTPTLNQFQVDDVEFDAGTHELKIVFSDAYDIGSIKVRSTTVGGSIAFPSVTNPGTLLNLTGRPPEKVHAKKVKLILDQCPSGTKFHVEIYGGDNGFTNDRLRPCILNTVAAPNGPNCMDNDGYLFGVQAQTAGNPHFFSINSYPQGFTCP
ncbi:MAG TPA: hypothetical protein VJB34_02405 [Bdellovibrionota bacterium]|nr:hypothetical protein [Bdellovibrionota bacterium]